MKITADTNLLVRALVKDDAIQGAQAEAEMFAAESIVVPPTVLCELVWVLSRVYRFDRTDVTRAIHTLLAIAKVVTDRPAAEAGIEVLLSGGDFADGLIAFEGRKLGGHTFVTFDKRALAALNAHGHAARLPMPRDA